MKVVLFGATGMVGAGALIECLAELAVTRLLLLPWRLVHRHERDGVYAPDV